MIKAIHFEYLFVDKNIVHQIRDDFQKGLTTSHQKHYANKVKFQNYIFSEILRTKMATLNLCP